MKTPPRPLELCLLTQPWPMVPTHPLFRTSGIPARFLSPQILPCGVLEEALTKPGQPGAGGALALTPAAY